MRRLIFKRDGIKVEESSTTAGNTKPSATEAILKGCEAAPGKDFTEKLQKVLEIWPELGERWLRER